MDENLQSLFAEVSNVFARHPTAVDIQTDSMDVLEIFQTILDDKGVFIGLVEDPNRADLFNDAIQVAKMHGLHVGAGSVNVHYRYRALKISDQTLLTEIEARSKAATRIVWATKSADTHRLLEKGQIEDLNDSELLGYPRCCATWHYDCYFARGIEAFADAWVKETSLDDALSLIRDGWRPSPGWFLPRELYLAGVLVSNHLFPFIGHIACPDCRRSASTPSGKTNLRNSEAFEALDAARHKRVLDYTQGLATKISRLTRRPAEAVDQEIGHFDWSVRARDAYSRHSRYLFKALGLVDLRL